MKKLVFIVILFLMNHFCSAQTPSINEAMLRAQQNGGADIETSIYGTVLTWCVIFILIYFILRKKKSPKDKS